MATVEKQGKGYLITVSAGSDLNGKRIRKYKTWTPPAGMTQRQIAKELQRQAVLFEDQVKAGAMQDSSIRFADFLDLWLDQYAMKQLKVKTVSEYEKLFPAIKLALGHIKLKDLKTGHLNSFYTNLQEASVRKDTKYIRRIDLAAELKMRQLTMAELHRRSGVSLYSIKSAIEGNAVDCKTAQRICDELGKSLNKVFTSIGAQETLSPNTVRHYHRIISSCLSKAVKWGYIANNPAANAELPKMGQQEAAHLDVEDAKMMLELLRDAPIKYRAAITFDLLSGLRRGELLGLRWRDVDFDAETIRIVQTFSYIQGRGLIFDTPKNKTSARPLRLSSAAFVLLRELQAWQERQAYKCGDAWKNSAGLVFTSDNGAPIHPDTLSNWFRNFCRSNGLPDAHIHSLRHTYASMMIAGGTPLVVVSRRMGHAQVSTTANIYAHVIADADEKAAQVTNVFNNVIHSNSEKTELFEKTGEIQSK